MHTFFISALHNAAQYCILLHCTVAHYITQYFTVLYYITLYCTVLHYITYYSVQYCIILPTAPQPPTPTGLSHHWRTIALPVMHRVGPAWQALPIFTHPTLRCPTTQTIDIQIWLFTTLSRSFNCF